jgi:hypothetical protein
MPPEYCEFSSSAKKCREWLEKAHPELVEVIYNTSAFSYPPFFPERRRNLAIAHSPPTSLKTIH